MLDWFRRKSPAQLRLERINAYVDGEMSPAERAEFEREIGQDSTLQAEVAALRELDATLNELPQVDVPRNFTIREPMPLPHRRSMMPAIAGLAMLVLVCGVIAMMLQSSLFGVETESEVADVPTLVVTQVVEVPDEVIVEEVVVTSVVEVPSEEVVVTLVVEVVEVEPTQEPIEAEAESEEIAEEPVPDDEYATTTNHWQLYSAISDAYQNELDSSDGIPRLYHFDEPLLAEFESELMAFEESQLLVVDLRPAFWEDGEMLDSADVTFTYQTCRDLQIYAIGGTDNGWATACSPNVLEEIIAVSPSTVQFTLAAGISREQFRAESAQAPIMAEHTWESVVTEALGFDNVEEGRDFLLSATP